MGYGLACGIWENELLCFIFRQKLHEFKKNISVKPFISNKNRKCKFMWYMRGWTFVFHFFHKICRISEEKSAGTIVNTRKIEDANSSGIWGKKLFLCTKVHKNCRMSEKISALKPVNTTKIEAGLASGIWENKLL